VALVRAALPANRFLGARCARAGLADPRDLRTWGDFERLPLTTKSELVEDQAAHPPFGTNLSHPIDRYVPVPGQSLPRYELKARRLVRRAADSQ